LRAGALRRRRAGRFNPYDPFVSVERPNLMVGLLGPVVVSTDGAMVQLKGRRERVVLAVLACAAGRVVRDDRMVEALWADDPPPSATGTLQAIVSRLRSTLGHSQERQSFIERVGDGYRLALPSDHVDADSFERELEQARRHRDEGAYALLEVALARWRGDALGDTATSPVLRPTAARLDELRLVAVEEQIELGLRLARHATLIPRLEQLVADQPLRERFTALLMTALYRAGRQADALRAFTRTRETLVEGLGLEPSQELVELQAAVLRHDDALTVVPVAPTSPSQATGRHPSPPQMPPAARTGSTLAVPDINFVDVDGVAIAWQQYGNGPDLVLIPPLASNIELIWEQPVFRRYLEYISRYMRVTHFDKRGVGLSDRFNTAPTLEQRTEDIRAVMDAAKLSRSSVLGMSEGGLIAQLFTVLHPERVSKLILVNSAPGATGFLHALRGSGDLQQAIRERAARFDHLVATWGRDPQYMADWFVPTHATDPAFVRWLGRLQRQTATAADIARQIASLRDLDAAAVLDQINVPTLIVHNTDDAVLPVAGARFLAERIAGAELAELPGHDHMGEVSSNWQDMVDRWLQFVFGHPPAQPAQRRLATVVFTDIVGSTEATNALGDRVWRSQLDEHDRAAMQLATSCSGYLIKSTGDGVLARFETPRDALQFAMLLQERLRPIGLTIRVGIHMGEVELHADGDIFGAAVNLSARVQQAAPPDSIVVSSTLRELLLGGELRFRELGEHHFKGFDAPWRLYALDRPDR
jgi:class 3 adenylate cyclase/DNA-binding SARP family transcriptional activator